MGKRKQPESKVLSANKKKKDEMEEPMNGIEGNPNAKPISPTSKIQVFKIDVFQCNNQPIGNSTELGASDLEDIWTRTLKRNLEEISGYTSAKTKNKEIRIQYQLRRPMSIRDIATELEFTHERSSIFATDIFRCRVVGLNEVRQAVPGETVRVVINTPNFDITPDQIVEWMSKFGIVKEGHRYTTKRVILVSPKPRSPNV
jgi:hypothetical protein